MRKRFTTAELVKLTGCTRDELYLILKDVKIIIPDWDDYDYFDDNDDSNKFKHCEANYYISEIFKIYDIITNDKMKKWLTKLQNKIIKNNIRNEKCNEIRKDTSRIVLKKDQVDWESYIISKMIIERGWSKDKIKKYVPNFDFECVNYNSTSRNNDVESIKLYSLQRIINIENSDIFKEGKSFNGDEPCLKYDILSKEELIKLRKDKDNIIEEAMRKDIEQYKLTLTNYKDVNTYYVKDYYVYKSVNKKVINLIGEIYSAFNKQCPEFAIELEQVYDSLSSTFNYKMPVIIIDNILYDKENEYNILNILQPDLIINNTRNSLLEKKPVEWYFKYLYTNACVNDLLKKIRKDCITHLQKYYDNLILLKNNKCK